MTRLICAERVTLNQHAFRNKIGSSATCSPHFQPIHAPGAAWYRFTTTSPNTLGLRHPFASPSSVSHGHAFIPISLADDQGRARPNDVHVARDGCSPPFYAHVLFLMASHPRLLWRQTAGRSLALGRKRPVGQRNMDRLVLANGRTPGLVASGRGLVRSQRPALCSSRAAELVRLQGLVLCSSRAAGLVLAAELGR